VAEGRLTVSFNTPALHNRNDARKLTAADRDWHYAHQEIPRPTYQMIMSNQMHEDEPRHPHGVPPGLRPSLIEILAGAPRVLPVSQEVEHGPEQSRSEEFQRGFQQASDLGRMHAFAGLGSEPGLRPWVYRSRRGEPKPCRVKGWQVDVPLDRYWSC
jgi:hypothetical protein